MQASKAVRMMSLSSGSNGNCYWFEGSGGSFLVDAGVSLRSLKAALQTYGIPLEKIGAVLVTHDHSDHIRDLGSFCKKLRIPVWVHPRIRHSTPMGWMTGQWLDPVARLLPAEGAAEILPGIRARSFDVPHDATHTVGYALQIDERKIVIMTDIGAMTPEALACAREASTVIVEANYDVQMLAAGPYPPELQARIRGGHGHLSNDECAAAVKEFMHDGLRNIFLCHLSAHNNTPEKALEAVGRVLGDAEIRLVALPRTEPSAMFEL